MRSNPIGLSTFILASPFSLDEAWAFDRVSELGYDVIEVCIEDPQRITSEWLVQQSERTGINVGICGAFGPDRDVSDPDSDRRESGIAYLRGCVDIAAAVGSPHVAGPMFSATGRAELLEPGERQARWQNAVESLRVVADYAADRGVRLAIEPLNRFETDMVNTVEQGLTLCDDIGRENVGLLVDTFHMNIEEKDIADAVRKAGSRIFHVQVSENDRGTPGSGHVPWDPFFHSLQDIHYSGQIVVESFLPTVKEIARAVSLWRPVAPSMASLSEDGLAFVKSMLSE
ncbi:sugar phosphate isomerase/epimerase family protein [Paenarthrobacter sp. NPDC089989]|uniref:sugar phosphate isomerase/epimerase family protein n=1 Tax=unclassified Paenarthrobacter TaxID=2634190 RepID=UPI00380FB800